MKLTKLAQEALRSGETVTRSWKNVFCNLKAGNSPKNAWGQEIEKDTLPGDLVITDQRVFHAAKFLFKKSLKDMPINSIAGVDMKEGMINSSITVHGTAGTRLELSTGNKKVAQEILAVLQEAQSKSKEPDVAKPDIADQIQKIADLHKQGILTDEEFQQKKTQLLEQI